MKTQKEIAPDIIKERNSVAERNKDLVRRAVKEIWNDGNYDDLEEFITRDFTIHFADLESKYAGSMALNNFTQNCGKHFLTFILPLIHKLQKPIKL